MDREMTPEDMFNKMMEDQQKMINAKQQAPMNPQMPQGQPGEPPTLDANQQRVLNELRTTAPATASTGMHPAQVASALPKCPTCGMLHPPNADGSPCANSPAMSGGNVVDLDMEINKHLVSLKNIAISQIQSKGIKNINKLLQYMTIEMTKLLEEYHE